MHTGQAGRLQLVQLVCFRVFIERSACCSVVPSILSGCSAATDAHRQEVVAVLENRGQSAGVGVKCYRAGSESAAHPHSMTAEYIIACTTTGYVHVGQSVQPHACYAQHAARPPSRLAKDACTHSRSISSLPLTHGSVAPMLQMHGNLT